MAGKIRMALVGLGIMGKEYAKMIDDGLIPDMELSAVCVRRKESGAWAEENLRHKVSVHVGMDELFAHADEFDAVLIVTPHKSHPEYVRRACACKKHVFCDKPAGVSVTDARNMSRWTREAGVLYAMMFHCRMLPEYQEVKRVMDSGRLGKLLRISMEVSMYRTAFYHRSGSWRSSWNGEGGGVLINQGQHELDMWQYLFGMPKELRASIAFGKYNDFMVDDEVLMELKYADDIRAEIFMTTGEVCSGKRLTVVGTGGKLVLEDQHLTVWTYDMDSTEYGKTAQATSGQQMKMTKTEQDFAADCKPRLEMLRNFADALLRGASLTAPGEEGEKALELTNGAYLSAWKDGWQKLPVDGGEYDRKLDEMMQAEREIKCGR